MHVVDGLEGPREGQTRLLIQRQRLVPVLAREDALLKAIEWSKERSEAGDNFDRVK